MDGRARFALAQAQKEARRAASAKVGIAEDLYSDLQRNHRKLSRIRIRASEVHVKASHVGKSKLDSWSARMLAEKTADDHARTQPSPQLPRTPRRRHGEADGLDLPSYIVEMNRELLEDDFGLPELDRAITPLGSQDVALDDLSFGLGDAAAAANTSMTLSMTGAAAIDQPAGMLATIADQSATAMYSAAASTATVAVSPRPGTTNREKLPPFPGSPAKQSDNAVPLRPVVELMPQRLASDKKWIHKPIWVSMTQVRWEKRDGNHTLCSMRRELMPKLCAEGLPKRLVHQGTSNAEVGWRSRRPTGPAEARIMASDPPSRIVTR